MAETFNLGQLIVPGTYVRVRAEGLVPGPSVSTGTIGLVGTAATGVGETHLVSSYAEVTTAFGAYDAFSTHARNLTRAAEVMYRNGAGTVYARAVAAAEQDDFEAAFAELVKDDVNILVAPELPTETALAVLQPVLETSENNGKDLMAVIGSDIDPTATGALASIEDQVPTNDRVVFTAPGIRAFDAAATPPADVMLPGTYGAAAVAGLLSTLSVQTSPTNKTLAGVVRLAHRFSYAEVSALIQDRVTVLEERGGVRVVRGITTDDGAFRPIAVRRIVDYAKAGIRQVADPFIGRLNNQRVRKALEGALNGFLTSMLVDEALIGYELAVTATRDDEINGRAMVNAVLQPTFSIEFVPVTLVLE